MKSQVLESGKSFLAGYERPLYWKIENEKLIGMEKFDDNLEDVLESNISEAVIFTSFFTHLFTLADQMGVYEPRNYVGVDGLMRFPNSDHDLFCHYSKSKVLIDYHEDEDSVFVLEKKDFLEIKSLVLDWIKKDRILIELNYN